MDTIIRNYNQRKQSLITTLLHKFCVDESRKQNVAKQLETIIDHTLTPSDPAIAIKRSKRETYLEVGSVVKNLKKEIAVLRHTNAKITSEMSGAPTSSIFNAEYVNTINQYILANAMKKNDFRELIMAYNSPVSPILNEDYFNKSLHVVSEYTNVEAKKIISRSRKSAVYHARRLLVVSILCFYKTTLVQLGKHLKKDHTTIIHYIDANKNWSYDNKKKTKSTLQVQGA
jgi:hypothetical protein